MFRFIYSISPFFVEIKTARKLFTHLKVDQNNRYGSSRPTTGATDLAGLQDTPRANPVPTNYMCPPPINNSSCFHTVRPAGMFIHDSMPPQEMDNANQRNSTAATSNESRGSSRDGSQVGSRHESKRSSRVTGREVSGKSSVSDIQEVAEEREETKHESVQDDEPETKKDPKSVKQSRRDDAKLQADLDEMTKWRSKANPEPTELPNEVCTDYHLPPINNLSNFHVVQYVKQPYMSSNGKNHANKKENGCTSQRSSGKRKKSLSAEKLHIERNADANAGINNLSNFHVVKYVKQPYMNSNEKSNFNKKVSSESGSAKAKKKDGMSAAEFLELSKPDSTEHEEKVLYPGWRLQKYYPPQHHYSTSLLLG